MGSLLLVVGLYCHTEMYSSVELCITGNLSLGSVGLHSSVQLCIAKGWFADVPNSSSIRFDCPFERMHASGSQMDVTCIEMLDVSGKIVGIYQTEDKSKLDNEVTYCWCPTQYSNLNNNMMIIPSRPF